MTLNIVNNIKSCYYNYMVVFYLCLNYFVPFYDDVIISMQSHSMKLLVRADDLDMKHIKHRRMINFINTLNDDDKLFYEKENNILTVEHSKVYSEVYSEDSDSYDDCQSQSQGATSAGTGLCESRKRQRKDDNDDIISDEINRNFDILNLNTDIKCNDGNKNKAD